MRIRPFVHALLSSLLMLLCSGAALAATAPIVSNLAPVTEKISAPVRLATDQFANIYLTDPRGGGLLKYDRTGKWVATLPIALPQAVAVTAGQELIVSQGNRVGIYSSNGTLRRYLGSGAGQFIYANGIAIDPQTGTIFVADSNNDCIQLFDANGQPITTNVAASNKPVNSFGTTGNATGQFSMPTGLTFERVTRQLAVVDTLNGRIQFFDPNSYLNQRILGTLGSGPLQFTSPQSVAFEYSRDANPSLARIYVVDSFQSRVQVIDPAGSGSYLREIGGYGRGAGKLQTPGDCIFDNLYSRLIVVNGQGMLSVYTIDSSSTPPNPDTTPPILTVNPASDISTNINSVSLNGTVTSGAVVAVSSNTSATVGPVSIAPTSPAGTSAWQVTVSNLTPGANAITVTAYSNAANAVSITRTVTYNNTTVVAISLNPVTSPTNGTSQLLSGTVESGSTVTINGSGATLGSCTTSCVWTYPVTLTSGLNNFSIVAAKAGKTNSTISTSINVVLTAPTMTVATLADASISGIQLLTVQGSLLVDQLFSSLTISHNNGPAQPIPVVNGAFAYPLLLAAGVNSITVTATDLAGNSVSDIRTVSYDPTLGQVTIVFPAGLGDGAVTSATTIDLSGTAPANATTVRISYLQGGTPFTMDRPVTSGSWTWTAPGINLDPGLNPLQVTSFNGSTQLTSTMATITQVPIDQPTLAITIPATDQSVNTSTLALSGKAGAASVTAAMDGTSVPVAFTPGTPGSFNLNLTFATEGAHLLAITATDLFGHAVTSYRTIYYQRAVPVNFITITSFTGQPTTLSGTLQPGAVLYVKKTDGSNWVNPVTAGVGGTWTITLPQGYNPAIMNLYALDSAGNSSRNGDINGIGGVTNIADVFAALQIARGVVQPTSDNLLRGDVAPFDPINNRPAPDGVIDIGDVLIMLRKIVGLITF